MWGPAYSPRHRMPFEEKTENSSPEFNLISFLLLSLLLLYMYSPQLDGNDFDFEEGERC
jgi:hypothetical protein